MLAANTFPFPLATLQAKTSLLRDRKYRRGSIQGLGSFSKDSNSILNGRIFKHDSRASISSGEHGDSNFDITQHYDKFVDLEPFVDTGTYTVAEDTPIDRVHRLFYNMGLRHMVVIDHANDVVGMITRKDLIADGKKQIVMNFSTAARMPTLLRKSSAIVTKMGVHARKAAKRSKSKFSSPLRTSSGSSRSKIDPNVSGSSLSPKQSISPKKGSRTISGSNLAGDGTVSGGDTGKGAALTPPLTPTRAPTAMSGYTLS